ncbi:MAG: alpha/beta hydrolase [Burkholderiales bacterium]|nr:alpha/beta hydrolase [Burkholderiales bacterium]
MRTESEGGVVKPSRSLFVEVRGLRYHVRAWGDPAHRKLVLLHGWMDVSASFQFAVDALTHDWYVLAPDWRGFGQTGNAPEGYWFPDYLADLDALLDAIAPDEAVDIVGHSMGGNIANLFAGIRPSRVRSLVLAEGFGLPATRPAQAPERYLRWLDELRDGTDFKPYADFDAVAGRLMRNNPRLTLEKARFLAPHWARVRADGRIELAADPKHKQVNPVLYRLDEAIACWQRITAPVLWLWGGDGDWIRKWLGADPDHWQRRREAFPQLTEATIPEAGHMMHHDQPRAFADAVENFCRRASVD